MKKFFCIMLFLLIVTFPMVVNAGIICSDGWESSCSVSGPGCCSHHGGVGKSYGSSSSGSSYSAYDNNYSSSSYSYTDGYVNDSDESDGSGLLTVLILGGLGIAGVVAANKHF